MSAQNDRRCSVSDLVQVPGDVDRARPLLARAEHADGVAPISDQALLAAAQGQRELVLFYAADDERAEAVLAVGALGQGELDLVVDPAARGRGVGRQALAALLGGERADNTELLSWAHGENPATEALLSGAGFVPVRSLYRMELDPALLPAPSDPLAVRFAHGLSLAPFDATRPATAAQPSDAERWVRVNAAAFASHPEQGRVTLADFALMREEPWFDPSELLLLGAPGAAELAGYTWVKTVPAAHDAVPDSAPGTAQPGPETELYAIGVDPQRAGGGLGRGLLEATLARMAQHAPSRVSLYVDGENERAVRMYEAAGFTVAARSRQWRSTPATRAAS